METLTAILLGILSGLVGGLVALAGQVLHGTINNKKHASPRQLVRDLMKSEPEPDVYNRSDEAIAEEEWKNER